MPCGLELRPLPLRGLGEMPHDRCVDIHVRLQRFGSNALGKPPAQFDFAAIAKTFLKDLHLQIFQRVAVEVAVLARLPVECAFSILHLL